MTGGEVTAALRCELVPLGSGGATGELPLLAVSYGRDATGSPELATPGLSLPNRVLAPGPVAELWRSARPVRCGRHGAVAWSEDGELLAGSLVRPLGADLVADTRSHFRDLLDLIEQRGYPHLLRIWNYLPRINEGGGDSERYRLFNVGRARAFTQWSQRNQCSTSFPASSAVGTPGAELQTAFLASALRPLHLENPRQTSAYRYPPDFGPQPPSFSRATLDPSGSGGAFFLAGTASIVGHETRHPGSVEGQLEETLRNIETMIEHARRVSRRSIPPLSGFDLIKVYLRDPVHLEPVRRALSATLRPETPTLFLEADICRADLVLEIEGVALG